MPTLVRFNRCRIVVFPREHLPPHFHILMVDGRQCLVEIETLDIMAGNIPRRDLREPLAWAKENREALNNAWKECNP